MQLLFHSFHLCAKHNTYARLHAQVSALGGRYVAWALCWWVWCGSAAALAHRPLSGRPRGSLWLVLLALTIGLVLPLVAAAAPFHPVGWAVHVWVEGAVRRVLVAVGMPETGLLRWHPRAL